MSDSLLFQCGNMAREGLRTLVVSKKVLTQDQYDDFEVSFLLSPFPYLQIEIKTIFHPLMILVKFKLFSFSSIVIRKLNWPWKTEMQR